MGQKLAQYFELAKKEGGLQAQMRLAMKTGMSSEAAKSAGDTPDAIAKVKGAFKEVLGKEAALS